MLLYTEFPELVGGYTQLVKRVIVLASEAKGYQCEADEALQWMITQSSFTSRQYMLRSRKQ